MISIFVCVYNIYIYTYVYIYTHNIYWNWDVPFFPMKTVGIQPSVVQSGAPGVGAKGHGLVTLACPLG